MTKVYENVFAENLLERIPREPLNWNLKMKNQVHLKVANHVLCNLCLYDLNTLFFLNKKRGTKIIVQSTFQRKIKNQCALSILKIEFNDPLTLLPCFPRTAN